MITMKAWLFGNEIVLLTKNKNAEYKSSGANFCWPWRF